MSPQRLHAIATSVIKQTLRQLPEAIRTASQECTIDTALMAEYLADDADLEHDLLGLFEGLSRADPVPDGPADLPRIRIFIDNLWDHAGGDSALFKEEVRITLLHELGHYLGLDEAQVAALGLA